MEEKWRGKVSFHVAVEKAASFELLSSPFLPPTLSLSLSSTAVHTWDRGGANSAWNRRPCSRRNYPEIFTRLHPLRADSSPSVALICLAGRQPGKLRTSRAIWYRDYLFVLMNRASFEFSPLSLSRISGLTLEILQLERFEEGELRKRFESLLKWC